MRATTFAFACVALTACNGDPAAPASSDSEQVSEQVSLLADDAGPEDHSADTVGANDGGERSGQETSEDVSAAIKTRPVACLPDETPIFSCRVKSGKRIAVCAADKTVQYHFGKDEPELTLTGKEWASAPYSGGGEAQIAFTNGDTRYIVFSRMVRTNFAPDEPNYPAISDGVIVERKGEVVSLQICDGDDMLPVQYSVAEEHLSAADELFSYQTERADRR